MKAKLIKDFIKYVDDDADINFSCGYGDLKIETLKCENGELNFSTTMWGIDSEEQYLKAMCQYIGKKEKENIK